MDAELLTGCPSGFGPTRRLAQAGRGDRSAYRPLRRQPRSRGPHRDIELLEVLPEGIR
jgi:hypothetical protein